MIFYLYIKIYKKNRVIILLKFKVITRTLKICDNLFKQLFIKNTFYLFVELFR